MDNIVHLSEYTDIGLVRRDESGDYEEDSCSETLNTLSYNQETTLNTLTHLSGVDNLHCEVFISKNLIVPYNLKSLSLPLIKNFSF